MRRARGAILLMAGWAIVTMAAVPALAQQFSGRVGYAAGWATVDGAGGDPAASKQEGFILSLESVLRAAGTRGELDYLLYLRWRGEDRQESMGGDTGTLRDRRLQTARGFIRWKPASGFWIQIANVETGPVAKRTENDPVENSLGSKCQGCEIGEISDEPFLNLQINFAGGKAGLTLGAEAPAFLSTTGAPSDQAPGSKDDRQATGANNARTLGVYFQWRSRGVAAGGFFIASTAENDQSGDGNFAGPGDFEGSASAWLLSASVNLGLLGAISVDLNRGASEMAPVSVTGSNRDTANNPFSEEEWAYSGVLLEWAGLRAGLARSSNTRGGDEDAWTVFSLHYRFPVGRGAWVAPEMALKNQERTRANGAVLRDQEQRTLRFLMALRF